MAQKNMNKELKRQPTEEGTWRALKGWQTRRDKNLAEDYLSDRFWRGHEYGTTNEQRQALYDNLRRIVKIERDGTLIRSEGVESEYYLYGKDYEGGLRILSYVIDYGNIIPNIIRITDLMC